MKVEIIDRPITNLVMTKEDKEYFYKVADMLDDLRVFDKQKDLWYEFVKDCANGYDDTINVESFDFIASLLRSIVDLAEIRD